MKNGQKGGKLHNFIVQLVHEAGVFASHRGIHTTLSRLRQLFWFPNMDTLVTDFIRSCDNCVTSRIGRMATVGVHSGLSISEPNERILFDFCQVRGGSLILVGLDCFRILFTHVSCWLKMRLTCVNSFLSGQAPSECFGIGHPTGRQFSPR